MTGRTWRSGVVLVLAGGTLLATLDVLQELLGPHTRFQLVASLGGPIFAALGFLAAGTGGAALGLCAWAVRRAGVKTWQLAIGIVVGLPSLLGWGAYVVTMNLDAFPTGGTCRERHDWLERKLHRDTIAEVKPALSNERVRRDAGELRCWAPTGSRTHRLFLDMNEVHWNLDLELQGSSGNGVLEIRGNDHAPGDLRATWVFGSTKHTFKLN